MFALERFLRHIAAFLAAWNYSALEEWKLYKTELMYKTYRKVGGIVSRTCRTVPDCCGSIPMQVVGVLCDVSIQHLHLHHDKMSSITSL
jgi:hypothetical protein